MKYKLTIIVLLLLNISVCYAQSGKDDELAAQYFQNKEFEKASDLYEKLYNQNPSGFYYNNYLQAILELKDYKKAEKFVKKAIRKNSQKLSYQVDLGYIYAQAGEVNDAEEQYNTAINNLVAEVSVVTDLANAFLIRRESQFALKTYLSGRKIIHNSTAFSYEIANIYNILGKYQEMLDEYLNLAEKDYFSVDNIEQILQVFLLDDVNNEKNQLIKNNLLKRTQKFPDKLVYSEMFIWYATQNNDFETAMKQAKSLDRREKGVGERVFNLAKLCVTNKFYDIAADGFNYVISKGELSYFSLNANIELLNAKYLKITESKNYTLSDLKKLESEIKKLINEIGNTSESVDLIKNLTSLYAFYMDSTEKAIDLLENTINQPNIKPQTLASLKLELADILLYSGDVWEATLLYSQVEKAFKNDPLGAEAKFRNAKLSFYIGEFEWAKAQLDILSAATSKTIANDALQLSLTISDNPDDDSSNTGLNYYAKADLLLYRNKPELALKTLDSIETLGLFHPLFDEVLFKKAQIMISMKNYIEADTLLGKLIRFYPSDILGDDALFLRAQLNEVQLNNKEKAMKYYEKIILDYPSSIYAAEARKKFRFLRGDKVL